MQITALSSVATLLSCVMLSVIVPQEMVVEPDIVPVALIHIPVVEPEPPIINNGITGEDMYTGTGSTVGDDSSGVDTSAPATAIQNDTTIVYSSFFDKASVEFTNLLVNPELYQFRAAVDLASILVCILVYLWCRKKVTKPERQLPPAVREKQREYQQVVQENQQVTEEFESTKTNYVSSLNQSMERVNEYEKEVLGPTAEQNQQLRMQLNELTSEPTKEKQDSKEKQRLEIVEKSKRDIDSRFAAALQPVRDEEQAIRNQREHDILQQEVFEKQRQQIEDEKKRMMGQIENKERKEAEELRKRQQLKDQDEKLPVVVDPKAQKQREDEVLRVKNEEEIKEREKIMNNNWLRDYLSAPVSESSNSPRKIMDETEKKQQEEKKKKEEQERKLKEEQEKKLREEQERKIKEEQERKLKEEQEKKLKEDQEKKRKEEHEKKLKEDQEKKLKEDQEKKLKEDQERKLKEEQERKLKEDQERKLREEQERKLKEDQEKKIKEEQERKLKEEQEKKLKEDQERKLREEQEKKNKEPPKPPPAIGSNNNGPEVQEMNKPTVDISSVQLRLGLKVKLDKIDQLGTIRYMGPVNGAPPGEFIGIEFDVPVGKNDGAGPKGDRYFGPVPANHGIFVKKDKIIDVE